MQGEIWYRLSDLSFYLKVDIFHLKAINIRPIMGVRIALPVLHNLKGSWNCEKYKHIESICGIQIWNKWNNCGEEATWELHTSWAAGSLFDSRFWYYGYARARCLKNEW